MQISVAVETSCTSAAFCVRLASQVVLCKTCATRRTQFKQPYSAKQEQGGTQKGKWRSKAEQHASYRPGFDQGSTEHRSYVLVTLASRMYVTLVDATKQNLLTCGTGSTGEVNTRCCEE